MEDTPSELASASMDEGAPNAPPKPRQKRGLGAAMFITAKRRWQKLKGAVMGIQRLVHVCMQRVKAWTMDPSMHANGMHGELLASMQASYIPPCNQKQCVVGGDVNTTDALQQETKDVSQL